MALVCLCYGVSDRRIAREIDQGARSIPDVTAACRAGGCCMSCHDTIEDLITERATVVSVTRRLSIA